MEGVRVALSANRGLLLYSRSSVPETRVLELRRQGSSCAEVFDAGTLEVLGKQVLKERGQKPTPDTP